MLIILQFNFKEQLTIEHDEAVKTSDQAVEICTNWKFYPKQIQVFRQAWLKTEFHDNFIRNVMDFVTNSKSNETTYTIKIMLNVRYQRVPDFIDVVWGKRLVGLIRARTEVEEALALLSTIGGAYSCLGERDVRCAEKAGMVAMRQLKLSSMRGDPNLVTRCFIYRVYSLCQIGEKKEAVRIMKQIIHPLITKMTFNHCCDEAVKNMYRAACHRIRYLTISNKG